MYNLNLIMTRAHRIRKNNNGSLSVALKKSWKIEKIGIEKVNIKKVIVIEPIKQKEITILQSKLIRDAKRSLNKKHKLKSWVPAEYENYKAGEISIEELKEFAMEAIIINFTKTKGRI